MIQFRYARHTADLRALRAFYTGIFPLEVKSSFEEHGGYNGLILAWPGAAWELEFTESPEPPHHHPDPDDLLVFYPETQEVYDAILGRIEAAGLEKQVARNDWWTQYGTLVLDPDGYGVVLSWLRIPQGE